MEDHQNKHQVLQPFNKERGCENVDFNSRINRQNYRNNVNGDDQHECDVCHKSFRSKSGLYKHQIGVHTLKSHVCPVCSKAFTTSSRLTAHSKFHVVREWEHHCSLCSRSFFTKYFLKMHMKTHSKKRQGMNLDEAGKTQIRAVADSELPDYASTPILKDLLEAKVVKMEPGADPDPEHTIDVKKVRIEGHMNWHEGVRPFKCEQGCENVDFHCQLKRQQHYREVHNRHEYDICHNLYRSKKTLTAHKESVHVPKRFGCLACNRTFTTAIRLKKHTKYSHSRERTHPCSKCNRLFCYKFEVATHLKRHEKAEDKMRAEADSEQVQDVLLGDSSTAMEEDFFEAEEAKIEPESDTEQPIDARPTVEKVKCFKCGKQIHESDKEAHRNWHLGIRPYNCELGCENLDFRSDHLRMTHYEQVHKRNECDICHNIYRSKKTLRDHKRCVHVPKTFGCSVCTLAFTTATRLKNHIRFTHNRERNHSCPKCNKLFGLKCEVARHLKRHEKAEEKWRAKRSIIMKDLVKTEPEVDSKQVQDVLRSTRDMDEDFFDAEEAKIEPESDTEQPTDDQPTVGKCSSLRLETGLRSYKCERGCENADFRSDQLRLTHYEKDHEGIECDICHKRLRHKRYLKNHKQSVHGEKKFPCVCGRSFSINGQLTRHINEFHMGEKDQYCPICSKAFIRKSDMNKHMRIHKKSKQANKSVELEDLFEAEEVKIEAREDHEQTVDIKEEPTDAATCSTQHTVEAS